LNFAQLAQLLQNVADNGASAAFYTGDVADEIVQTVSVLADIYSSSMKQEAQWSQRERATFSSSDDFFLF